MSSTASASSSLNSQEVYINELKLPFDFNQSPLSLKRYRIQLIIGYIMLMSIAFGLLGVNIYAKGQFINNLQALQT